MSPVTAKLEVADDEPVELGDTDPAGVIFDCRNPIADGRLLGQQRGTAALLDEVVARRWLRDRRVDRRRRPPPGGSPRSSD